MDRPITLQTIADKAKVSKVTVSRALRNHPSLPKTTCLRVQELAAKMGYRVNPLVSALMAQVRNGRPAVSHSTIAYLTTNADPGELEPGRTHAADIYYGAIERAASLGYKLEKFSLIDPGMTTSRMSEVLRARGIPGAILAPLADPFPQTDIVFNWEYLACAAIGYSTHNQQLHRADNDHFYAASLAAAKLREKGYRRIGLAIRHEDNQRTQRKRVGGYLAAQAEWPMSNRIPPYLWHYRWSDNEIPAGFGTWFARYRPEVILVLQHVVRQWLRILDHRVPEEVALASLNLQYDQATFSGINLNNARLGAAAVELIVEQIHHNEHGVPSHSKTILIEGDWSEGRTTPGPASIPVAR